MSDIKRAKGDTSSKNISVSATTAIIGIAWACVCACFLTSCAIVPKPTTQEPTTLTLNIAGKFYDAVRDRTITKSALTYWRKIENSANDTQQTDQSTLHFGDRFAIGGANAFNRALNTSRFRNVRDEVVVLDSGEYVLDSFELETPKSIAISMEGDYTERDGWDYQANAPKYLSVRVPPHTQLTLPKMIIKVIQDANTLPHTQQIELIICVPDTKSIPPQIRLGTQLRYIASKTECAEVFSEIESTKNSEPQKSDTR